MREKLCIAPDDCFAELYLLSGSVTVASEGTGHPVGEFEQRLRPHWVQWCLGTWARVLRGGGTPLAATRRLSSTDAQQLPRKKL